MEGCWTLLCVCVCVFGDWQGQGQGSLVPEMRNVNRSRIRDVWSPSQGRLWEPEGGCEVRIRTDGSEHQAEVDQKTPQTELHFGGKTLALVEQEPLFLMTSSSQFREGAQRPRRMRGHKRQCRELWEHIREGT